MDTRKGPSLLPPTHQLAAAKTVLLFSGAHLPRMTYHPFLAAHASAKMLFTSTGSTRSPDTRTLPYATHLEMGSAKIHSAPPPGSLVPGDSGESGILAGRWQVTSQKVVAGN